MLNSATELVRSAAKKLNLNDEDTSYVLTPEHVHEFAIRLSSGDTFDAFRVQHNSVLGPYKGGIRFHPEVDINEVKALALLMSLKTAAMNLPYGGGKGGVTVNPKTLHPGQLEELSRLYARTISEAIGPEVDIPAPDMNTNAQIIDWMVDEYKKVTGDKSHASFTGKSLENGGSEGRVDATGRGGAVALAELYKKRGEQQAEITYAVQGFGNVGQYLALTINEYLPNAKLVAVSDSSATIVNASGFDPAALIAFKDAGGAFSAFSSEDVAILPGEEILSRPVDVMVFAALGDVVTEENYEHIAAKYILELANGPVNDAAQEKLSARGVTIIPDIIANAGGVTVSYFEWMQNRSGERWDKDKVHRELESKIRQAVDDVVGCAVQNNVTLKEAAAIIATERILKARNKEA